MGLERYNKKRNFNDTPEPEGKKSSRRKSLSFVIQRHQATRLHYDFRLEMEGVLKSWAVPKGPSLKKGEKRLAVMVEDHPLEYGSFFGEIPEGNYGAGIVDIFDKGTYTAYKAPYGVNMEKHLLSQLQNGDLKVILKGKHINGAFALVRLTGEGGDQSSNWLLIKKNDEYAVEDFDIEKIKPIKTTGKTKYKKERKDKLHENLPEDKVWLSLKTDKKEEKKSPVKQEQPSFNQENDSILEFGKKKLKLTNLNKIYWPDEGYTKGELIKYYLDISEFILPYLKNRPQSLNRFPNGIKGASFYHKDMKTDKLPSWTKTVKLYSKANDHDIDYLICNDIPTLLYMANLGCIEINPWHSTYLNPEYPDYMMLDLDPGNISFKEVVNTALVIKEISDELKIKSYCKTSGATGLHIYFPLGARYNYNQVKIFAEILANLTHSRIPSVTTVERTISKRGEKIYVDFLQNRKGQTIAAPYSVRPRLHATVSTPLEWNEVNHNLTPDMFTIRNTKVRLEKKGDLWQGIFKNPLNIEKLLKKLEKLK